MALVVPPGHSPIASEFLAEEALISIVPKFRHDKFQFITGTYGPFVPQRSVEVPLWLACRLSRSDMCTIIMPDWLTVENLTACKEEEISRIDTFSERVPKSYQETCAVLFEVDDSTADLHQIVEDIANVRATKIRSGVIGLAKSATLDETTHSVKMNSVGTAEVAAIRTQLSMSLNKFWALRKHQTKPLRNNGKRRDSRHDNNRTTTPVHTDETAPRRQLRRFR